MKNQTAKVIDELNRRMEEALENDDIEAYDTLDEFYDWFLETFIF